MDPLGVTASEFVAEMGQAFWHATPAIQSIDPKGHQLVLPLLSQALNDVDVLTWKVLMNEKNPHEIRDAEAIPPCPEILPAKAAGRTPSATDVCRQAHADLQGQS